MNWREPCGYRARASRRAIYRKRRTIAFQIVRLHVYGVLLLAAFAAAVRFTGLSPYMNMPLRDVIALFIFMCYFFGAIVLLTIPAAWVSSYVNVYNDRIVRTCSSGGVTLKPKDIAAMRVREGRNGLGVLRMTFRYRRGVVTLNVAIPPSVDRSDLHTRIESLLQRCETESTQSALPGSP